MKKKERREKREVTRKKGREERYDKRHKNEKREERRERERQERREGKEQERRKIKRKIIVWVQRGRSTSTCTATLCVIEPRTHQKFESPKKIAATKFEFESLINSRTPRNRSNLFWHKLHSEFIYY